MKSFVGKINILLSVSILGISLTTVESHTKNLENTYPGFEQKSVIMIGDNGEEIVGYFVMNDSLARSDGLLSMFSHNIEEDVTFTLYNRANPDGLTIGQVSDLPKHVDKSKKIKCVTHGWLSNGKSPSCILIKNAYMNTSDVNIIIIDWSPISGNVFYPIPMRATSDVAEYYGKFLNHLVDDIGINPRDIHLIGHSLGAHLSGFAGRLVRKGKIGRITALDPASPGFNIGLVGGGRLYDSDAEFVDVIHTCSGYLGIKEPIGHVDFYPNGGGPPQPGCTMIRVMEACSHGRSFQLFARSITLEENYLAKKCPEFSFLGNGKCEGESISMGESTPFDARGIYYIQTTDKDPFL